jgi:hypothetical protein
MDDESKRKPDDLVTLTPDMVDEVKRTIGYLRGGVDALRALQKRAYISVEQAAELRAEATELEKLDIEPLRAALRDGAIFASQRETVERLGEADL